MSEQTPTYVCMERALDRCLTSVRAMWPPETENDVIHKSATVLFMEVCQARAWPGQTVFEKTVDDIDSVSLSDVDAKRVSEIHDHLDDQLNDGKITETEHEKLLQQLSWLEEKAMKDDDQ